MLMRFAGKESTHSYDEISEEILRYVRDIETLDNIDDQAQSLLTLIHETRDTLKEQRARVFLCRLHQLDKGIPLTIQTCP